MLLSRRGGYGAGDELISQQKHGLQQELPVAEVEEVFQTRSEKIEGHSIIVAFRTEPTSERDSDTSSKGLIRVEGAWP